MIIYSFISLGVPISLIYSDDIYSRIDLLSLISLGIKSFDMSTIPLLSKFFDLNADFSVKYNAAFVRFL